MKEEAAGEFIKCRWLVSQWGAPFQEHVVMSWRGETLDAVEHTEDAPSVIVAPGLLNCHVHVDDPYFINAEGFIPWLRGMIAFRQKEVVTHARSQVKKMLETGTVAWGNIVVYPWSQLSDSPWEDREVSFLEVLGDVDSPFPSHLCHLSPHSPYALTPGLLEFIWREKRGILKAVHLAESADEVAFVQGKSNAIEEEIFLLKGRKPFIHPTARSPVEYMNSLGCVDDETLAIHSVFVDERDIEILVSKGASVVTCPRSNLYLSKEIAPLPLLKEAGIPVALGTDGLASTPNLSLWEEMRALWFVARVKGWRLNPEEILGMATGQGAEVLRLRHLASLRPGNEASFLVIEAPSSLSAEDLPAFVLFQGDAHLKSVYIKGKKVS